MEDAVDVVLHQWHTERPDLDPSPMGVIGRVQRAAQHIERRLQVVFEQHDLQHWEFDVLATLRRSGRLTAGRLVDATMVSSGAMTNRIDRLVQRGLVTRDTDPANRRSVLVDLTDAGRDLIDVAVVAHVDNARTLIDALDRGEQDQLADLLRTLLTSFGDRAPRPT